MCTDHGAGAQRSKPLCGMSNRKSQIGETEIWHLRSETPSAATTGAAHKPLIHCIRSDMGTEIGDERRGPFKISNGFTFA